MKLFEPGKIGRLSLENRIVMAPMGIGGLIDPDGRLSPQGMDYYVTRAKGGAGLVITCIAFVSREIEQVLNTPFARYLMVDNNVYVAQLNRLAEFAHDYGAKVAVQLTAGVGLVYRPEYVSESRPVAPSALPCFWAPSITARELTIQEVERLVQAFEFSAKILSTAGIDAIELHGHGGYLFDQFMTALWNKRIDKYGGDLEGRLRFPLEVIEAIRRGAGADFPIIYRYALTHYLEGGREIEEGLEIARRLEAAGVDALDIDAGSQETTYWFVPPTTQPPGCWIDLAEMVKKVVKIPVIVAGKLGDPELAEKVLQEGKADFIALGRPLLADPEWPDKVKAGRLEDIRPCLGCHEGCLERRRELKYISCAVNPATGMEREFTIRPTEEKKSVLVVGGGPAGMEAARVAALRGHKVVLWEKGDALGGNLIPASVPDFKQDYRSLINYLSTQVKKLGVTIEFRKEATPELIQEMKPEVVFVATGGTPIIPEIPGIDRSKVVTCVDLLLGKREVGESVVVVGGGLVGSEMALYLAQKGKKVTIVEILDSIARDMFSINRMHLLKLLTEANVEILTDTMVLEITDEGIATADKYGKRSIREADTVVLAVGLKPDRKLLETLKDKLPKVYAIGDCVEPRKVINAIWEGFRTARLI